MHNNKGRFDNVEKITIKLQSNFLSFVELSSVFLSFVNFNNPNLFKSETVALIQSNFNFSYQSAQWQN